jgi:arylsulfatase
MLVLAATALYLGLYSPAGLSQTSERPNIVLIVADDLGYSDLGIFGGEIPTPNIDALAQGGMLLTGFHANMTCSPTRAMLLSGTDSHLAGLGVMGRATNPAQQGRPGYEGHLNFRVASMANLLGDAGYRTYMTGKWHLGEDVETGPIARGFEHAFVSIDGASHLGGLSWNGPGKAPYRDDEDLITVGDDFYTTRFYTERMIEYIDGSRNDGDPFFAYLAYTAPHWPLQAPKESIAKFAGWYDDGYEALYQKRLARSKSLGLVPPDFAGIPPIAGQAAWDTLSADEQRTEARKMEIYAAMVSDMDRYIGEFIAYLDAIGELDNTFIFFMSDNGPEATRRELFGGVKAWVERCCNNSYDNLGAGDSYVMYGPNWARASSVPFRRAKATAFEGGTHVPAFANYPGLIAAGTRGDEFASVMDVLPTFLQLAGTSHPGETYRGRPVLPLRGRSMLPLLLGQTDRLHDPNGYMGWELYGHRGIRQRNWKIVWDPSEGEAAGWRLFDLARDPGEQHDISAQQPEKLSAMRSLWDAYQRNSGVILAR